MEEKKKLNVEFKQTVKGIWYIGSLKVDTDNLEELDKIIDSTIPFLKAKIDTMNQKGMFTDLKPRVPVIELREEEKSLFEKLRVMRMDLAKAENIPPYMVFHDSVLTRLAKYKPMTKEEMLNIDGIGERNFEKYGVYFLKVIRSDCLL